MKLTRLKSERPRRAHDFYPTPYGLAKSALMRLADDEPMWGEPYEVLDVGCGDGIWTRAAKEVFYPHKKIATYGIDIEPKHTDDWTIKGDFLKCDNLTFNGNYFSLLYGNPPYSFMEEFIRHALDEELLFRGGYVFFLGRLEFLASQKRAKGLFLDYPPKRIYVLSRRPSFFSTNGHKTTDAQDYAMYLWEDGFDGYTQLDWLNWEYDKRYD